MNALRAIFSLLLAPTPSTPCPHLTGKHHKCAQCGLPFEGLPIAQ